MSLVVGLTGGVASGKSTVALAFEALGVPTLDADQVSRDVVAPPSPVLAAIAERFGRDMLQADGTLDRARLRAVVFADAEALRALEALTHPAIRAHIAGWLQRQTAPYCLLVNAILIESGMDRLVQRVLVVDAPEAVQLRRLTRRDAMAPEAAQRMIDAQASRARRLARADDVIDNSDEALPLQPAVQRLHAFYLQRGGAVGTAPR